MNSEVLFSKSPPVKLFYITAVPGVIGMFAMSIYNIIEGIFVGQFIGGDAFAAMNLAMPFVFITFALSDMIGVGSSVPISIAHGAGDDERANNIFTCSVLLIIGTAFVTGTAMFTLAPYLIGMMGAEDEVAEMAIAYLRVNAVMNALLIRMGGTIAVSAFSVLMYCSDLVQPFLYGICDSMQPAIGFNWGAKAYGRVKSLVKCVFTSTAILSLAAFAAMFIFSRPIASIFVNGEDAELLDLSTHALRLFSIEFLFWWLGYAAQSFYNAIERPKNAAILTLSTAIVFPLLSVALLWNLGLDGLWLNQAVSYIPVDIIAIVMLRKTQKELATY